MGDDPTSWQERLHDQNERWYPGSDAPQVAAAFVLQYLLQVPAQTLAYAVGLGPWIPSPSQLTFDLGPGGSPTRIHLGSLLSVTASEPLEGSAEAVTGGREREAEGLYREVAEPLATAYASIAPIGPRTRAAMVTDMWRLALAKGRAVERESCCFLYALPGCHECAGCPRQGRSARS